jgi:NadR type nicotinamide-nucleotide adenylyltransferase
VVNVGLTLGKFAPLHRGHQLVIETALRETDHVIVLIYAETETAIPLSVRANWIRDLYPSVEVIEAADGPTTVGYAPQIVRLHDEYIASRVRGRGVTHFFSSEPYGEHVSRALGAIDRRVDQGRAIVPVSATAIRADPFANRHWLNPIVYASFVQRIAFLGAPSTGKTTLASHLAQRHSTQWMPEYGREYWEKHQINRRLRIEELVTIAEEHRRIEDRLAGDANRFLFVDTEAMTTRLYAIYYHGRSLPRLDELAGNSAHRYQQFFLCENDFPHDDTPDRSGEVIQHRFQASIRDDLDRRCLPYISLRGSVEERMQTVDEILRDLS